MNKGLIYIGIGAGAAGLYLFNRLSALPDHAARTASTAAHWPFQQFRDPDADGSTPGTQAWFSNQYDRLISVMTGEQRKNGQGELLPGPSPSPDPDISIWYEGL